VPEPLHEQLVEVVQQVGHLLQIHLLRNIRSQSYDL
jgi:hypothetical protein